MVGHHVEDDGDQQHSALDHILPVVVQAVDGHALVDDAQQNGADHDAGNRTGSAVGGGAADEAGADGVHLIRHTGIAVDGTNPGGDQQTRQACQYGHGAVSGEVDLPGIDTGELGGLLVAAHGVEVTAKCGLGGDEGVEQQNAQHPHQHDGNALVVGQLPAVEEDQQIDEDHFGEGADGESMAVALAAPSWHGR